MLNERLTQAAQTAILRILSYRYRYLNQHDQREIILFFLDLANQNLLQAAPQKEVKGPRDRKRLRIAQAIFRESRYHLLTVTHYHTYDKLKMR